MAAVCGGENQGGRRGARVVPLRGTTISAVSARRLGSIALLGITFAWLNTGDIFDILKEKSSLLYDWRIKQ